MLKNVYISSLLVVLIVHSLLFAPLAVENRVNYTQIADELQARYMDLTIALGGDTVLDSLQKELIKEVLSILAEVSVAAHVLSLISQDSYLSTNIAEHNRAKCLIGLHFEMGPALFYSDNCDQFLSEKHDHVDNILRRINKMIEIDSIKELASSIFEIISAATKEINSKGVGLSCQKCKSEIVMIHALPALIEIIKNLDLYYYDKDTILEKDESSFAVALNRMCLDEVLEAYYEAILAEQVIDDLNVPTEEIVSESLNQDKNSACLIS